MRFNGYETLPPADPPTEIVTVIAQLLAPIVQPFINPRLARRAKTSALIVDINSGYRQRTILSDALGSEGFPVSLNNAEAIFDRLHRGEGWLVDMEDLAVPMRIGLASDGDGLFGYFRARLYRESFERTFMRFAAAPTYKGARRLWTDIYAQPAPPVVRSHPGFGARPPWIAIRALDSKPGDPENSASLQLGHGLAVALSTAWFRRADRAAP